MNTLRLFLACAFLLATGTDAHGYMLNPAPRASSYIKGDSAGSAGSCATGICFWFSQSCTIGCPECGGSDGNPYCGALPNASVTPGQPQIMPTLPDYARSWWFTAPNYTKPPCADPANPAASCPVVKQEFCGFNPWCAPGHAPIMNPCGVAGGDVKPGAPGNGGNPPAHFKQGDDSRKIPQLKTPGSTWKVGSQVNVSWAVIANHGGGYQYRLCKNKDGTGATQDVSEECFQANPVPFAGKTQYIEYCTSTAQFPPYNSDPTEFPTCDHSNKNLAPGAPAGGVSGIEAVDVSEGTLPKGSTWRRNPIPGCRSANGGAFGELCGAGNGTSADDFQFPPAGPDYSRAPQLLGGFGAGGCYGAPYGRGCGQPGMPNSCGTSVECLTKLWKHMFHFNIIDTLEVPDVPKGEYVLSFRWDCEQTPQIWSTCSDVTIE